MTTAASAHQGGAFLALLHERRDYLGEPRRYHRSDRTQEREAQNDATIPASTDVARALVCPRLPDRVRAPMRRYGACGSRACRR